MNISRNLIYRLRHNPIDLSMSKDGFVSINEILELYGISLADLEHIVETNDKQRLAFNDNKTKIRANQGHSIKWIDLGLKSKIPPTILYHGTADIFIKSIMKNGLLPKKRQHIHLSIDVDTATTVGKRHGKHIILEIDCKSMVKDNIKFYLSDNSVWLVENIIKPKYLKQI